IGYACGETTTSLDYVRCLDQDGNNWAAPVVIDNTDWPSIHALAVINGNPAVAYVTNTKGDYSVSDLWYRSATEASGGSWNAATRIDTALERPSLVEVDGHPAIAYSNAGDYRLRYIRATDVDGTAWPVATTLDAAESGVGLSMQVVDGNPAIGFEAS